jgi:pimeloyl-ACP methyl ester carboxylesterase
MTVGLAVLVVLALATAACRDGPLDPGPPALPDGEPVTVPAPDGIQLAGLRYGDGPTAVVLAHQRGGAKEDWTSFATAVADAGHTALAIDLRGYGGSPGERDTDLDVDLAGAVAWLRDSGAAEVVLVGASMGGTAAVTTAVREEVAGVVSLSAPARFADLDAGAAAAQLDVPALFVAARDDAPYAQDAEAMAEVSGGRVVLYDGDQHGTGLFRSFGASLSGTLLEFVRTTGGGS